MGTICSNRAGIQQIISPNSLIDKAHYTCPQPPQGRYTTGQALWNYRRRQSAHQGPYTLATSGPGCFGGLRPGSRRRRPRKLFDSKHTASQFLFPVSLSQPVIVSHTLHGVARLPLELGRVAAELVVRAKDERNVGCVLVSVVQGTRKGNKRETNSYACRQASIEG